MKLFEGIEFGARIDAANWQDYELLDAGGFEKLERFGIMVGNHQTLTSRSQVGGGRKVQAPGQQSAPFFLNLLNLGYNNITSILFLSFLSSRFERVFFKNPHVFVIAL